MKEIERLKQLPWKKIIPIAVFLITIALNIWLGCMPVFKGKYLNRKDGITTKITFYDNTYQAEEITSKSEEKDSATESQCSGFFYVEDATITISRETKWSLNYSYLFGDSSTTKCSFYRQSVFSFYIEETEYTGHSYRKVKRVYTCHEAIVLQVFYIIIEFISGICTFCILKNIINTRNKKSDIIDNQDE